MAEVLASIPFPDDMRAALTAHIGPKGELLRSILHWERGEAHEATRTGIAPGRLAAAHTEAIAWADDAASELLDNVDDSDDLHAEAA
jgi:hypothetical protein